MKKINLFLKRSGDILGSVLGLLFLSPLIIFVSILIKLTSEGPVFFRQERLGKDGKVIKIIKFRTMVVNAEHIGDGLKIKQESDSRITRIGRILRKTSIDEIPQLLNTLGGSMSLIGPRPPVTYHPYAGYAEYPAWAKKRFVMRPGITGLAQVTVRNSTSWDNRIKIDNQYIDNFNVFFDMRILFKTAICVFKKGNIYS